MTKSKSEFGMSEVITICEESGDSCKIQLEYGWDFDPAIKHKSNDGEPEISLGLLYPVTFPNQVEALRKVQEAKEACNDCTAPCKECLERIPLHSFPDAKGNYTAIIGLYINGASWSLRTAGQ